MVRGEGRIGKKKMFCSSRFHKYNLTIYLYTTACICHRFTNVQPDRNKKRQITLVKIKLKKVTEVDYRTTNSHH